MCMPHMYALYVCLTCMPHMYALYVCLMTGHSGEHREAAARGRPRSDGACVCVLFIRMLYMYALYVRLVSDHSGEHREAAGRG